jgi:phosphoglycerol transferase MdoB-like AlkP superfamily enzyme
MNVSSKIPVHLLYLFLIYLSSILFFFIFRLILFFVAIDFMDDVPDKIYHTLMAFWMGFRFDTVITGYLIIVPTVVLALLSSFGKDSKKVYSFFTWFLFLLFVVAFFITAADIPYFTQFFNRLNIAALHWTDNFSFMAGMILGEARYYIYIFLFIIQCILFYFLLKRINKFIAGKIEKRNISLPFNITLSVFALAFIFIGIRGRITKKSPIRIGTAYFSNYAFPNQLGLNPVFTFMRSWMDELGGENRQLKLMEDAEAVRNIISYYQITGEYNEKELSIARMSEVSGEMDKKNIVLIIMESMGAIKMGRYGSDKNMTPFLDSLAQRSYSFDNIYTAGIHTFNGVFSTLFSHPALMDIHSMKEINMQEYYGFPNILHDKGYRNIFFTTHDEQFDNMGGFMSLNKFHRIVSQKDYPSEEVLSATGVPDHFMFDFALPVLDEEASSGKPFFATFLTGSDHGPWIIPQVEGFAVKNEDRLEAIVEYADMSLQRFIRKSLERDWSKNTIFVFIADHGAAWDRTYDMPLSYHHSPFIIYSPDYIKEPKSFSKVGGQIDVMPTVLGLINCSYMNYSLGMDLLREDRKFIAFSADDKIGCVNDEYFLVLRNDGSKSLYKYRKREVKNYYDEKRQLADSMETFAKSFIQTSQYLVSKKKVK